MAIIGFFQPERRDDMRTAKFRQSIKSNHDNIFLIDYYFIDFKGLGIMTLLSMGVMLLNIVSEMPKFSLNMVEGKRGSFSGVPLLGSCNYLFN